MLLRWVFVLFKSWRKRTFNFFSRKKGEPFIARHSLKIIHGNVPTRQTFFIAAHFVVVRKKGLYNRFCNFNKGACPFVLITSISQPMTELLFLLQINFDLRLGDDQERIVRLHFVLRWVFFTLIKNITLTARIVAVVGENFQILRLMKVLNYTKPRMRSNLRSSSFV